MEDYLPDELVLIGYAKRIVSVQSVWNSYPGRGRTSVGPLFPLQDDRTARSNGHKYRLVWCSGHHGWRWTLNADQHAVVVRGMCRRFTVYSSYWFGWRGPGFCMGPRPAFYLGTEWTTTNNSLVSFRWVATDEIGIRQGLIIEQRFVLNFLIFLFFFCFPFFPDICFSHWFCWGSFYRRNVTSARSWILPSVKFPIL